MKPSLLTQIRSHHYWGRLKAVTRTQTSSSTIFFLSLICHLCLPCLGLPCHALVCHAKICHVWVCQPIWSYHVCVYHCLISSRFIFMFVLYIRSWYFNGYDDGQVITPMPLFLFLESEQLFFYCHHCSLSPLYSLALLYSMYLTPYLHLTPFVLTLLLVFISLCLYLTPLSLPYSMYIPYSLIYMCLFLLFFRSFLSD